jgi:hypothetical protein
MAGQRCRARANATAIEQLSANRKQITGVLSKRTNTGVYRFVTILAATLTAGAGQSKGVSVDLDSTGQMLRSKFKNVPSDVEVTATTSGRATSIRTAKVTFGPDPPKARIAGTPTTKRARATVKFRCQGLSTQICRGTVTLTTFEKPRLNGTTIAELLSSPSSKDKLVTIAAGAWSVRTGKTLTLRVGLNTTGSTLLRKFGKIPCALTIAPTYTGYALAAITRTIQFER